MGRNVREPFHVWLDSVAVMRIRQTLVFCNGNRDRAARLLGMSRYTLRRYLIRANAKELAAIPSTWPQGFQR